jgi:hypothetical protein
MFFVFKLPIWHDEFYSVWAAGHSFLEIALSIPDKVHPPGYYLLLHYWQAISTSVFWFRTLTALSFAANVFLVRKIAKEMDLKSPLLLVFLYVFSGYFIVFDWQIRMYTLIDTLIFSSLILLTQFKREGLEGIKLSWLGFILINFFGLYIDYAFLWYFVPTALFSLVFFALKKKSSFIYLLYSYIASSLLFIVANPTFFNASKVGIKGISWMEQYINHGFWVPFFLGSHQNFIFSILFFGLLIFGVFAVWDLKIKNFAVWAVFFSALSSLTLTLVYSYFFTPLFHIRSLQIVGILVILLFYYGIVWLPKRVKFFLIPLIIGYILLNFLSAGRTLMFYPSAVLVDYFPWRDVLNRTDLKGIRAVKYNIENELPTPMLLYGLEYTLNGNENLGREPIKLSEYDPEVDTGKCGLFYTGIMKLYSCK